MGSKSPFRLTRTGILSTEFVGIKSHQLLIGDNTQNDGIIVWIQVYLHTSNYCIYRHVRTVSHKLEGGGTDAIAVRGAGR